MWLLHTCMQGNWDEPFLNSRLTSLTLHPVTADIHTFTHSQTHTHMYSLSLSLSYTHTAASLGYGPNSTPLFGAIQRHVRISFIIVHRNTYLYCLVFFLFSHGSVCLFVYASQCVWANSKLCPTMYAVCSAMNSNNNHPPTCLCCVRNSSKYLIACYLSKLTIPPEFLNWS